MRIPLKRYVLLNDDTIIDQVTQPKELIYFHEVKKTSDNILDLVEVGDMVANTYDILVYVLGIIIIDGKVWSFDCLHELLGAGDITAIYKRQPNGDYKRYCVGDNK